MNTVELGVKNLNNTTFYSSSLGDTHYTQKSIADPKRHKLFPLHMYKLLWTLQILFERKKQLNITLTNMHHLSLLWIEGQHTTNDQEKYTHRGQNSSLMPSCVWMTWYSHYRFSIWKKNNWYNTSKHLHHIWRL